MMIIILVRASRLVGRVIRNDSKEIRIQDKTESRCYVMSEICHDIRLIVQIQSQSCRGQ